MSFTQDFIQKHKNAAILDGILNGVPPSITLAQAILESGWGKSDLAENANNYFGIKADSSWKGQVYNQPTEEWNGSNYIVVNSKFRKYNSAYESFRDHSRFLKENKNYKKAFDYPVDDYINWITQIKAGGYATAPDYVPKIVNLIDQYDLYIYDNQAKFLKYIKKGAEIVGIIVLIYLAVKLYKS